MNIPRLLSHIVLPAVLGMGCELLSAPKSPHDYASDLAACEAASASWEEYIPCCEDVARNYDRDPSFCDGREPADAGEQ